MKTIVIIKMLLLVVISANVVAQEVKDKVELTEHLNQHYSIEKMDDLAKNNGAKINTKSINNSNIPDFLKDTALKQINQMKQQGYYEADDASAVNYIDEAMKTINNESSRLYEPSSRGLHNKNLNNMLSFSPSGFNINNLKKDKKIKNKIGKIKLLSTSPSGGLVDDRWTAVDRLYDVEDLGIVALNEWDYVTSEGEINFIEEAINYEVNGYPAMFSVVRFKNRYLSELAWATETRSYTLSYNGSTKKKKELFLALANMLKE